MALLRRFAVTAALAVIAALVPAGVALAQDRDCADFPSQAAAQSALQQGDPERLDGDDDGIACEDLAGGSSGNGTGEDMNCDDFATRQEAQGVLEGDPSDPNNLDADNDGVACEDGNETAGGNGAQDGTGTAGTGTVGGDNGQAPSGGVATGNGGTAGDGFGMLPVTLLGGGALLAGAAVMVWRRGRTD